MTVKLAINGFGRIGRCILRAWIESGRDDVEIIAVNDLAPIEANAHLLQFDSVHGPFGRTVTLEPGRIVVDGRSLRVTSERDPAKLDWGDVDIALECTGVFRTGEAAQAYLTAGAQRVLISAPGKDVDRTVVYGVNHHLLTGDDVLVSNASCTTNCLAPIAMVLDEALGLKTGYMTTVHSYTTSQPVLDSAQKDLHRARAAAMSIIPTTTGAARAVGLVLPQLEGKLNGSAIRVPTPNVSAVDLCFMPGRSTSAQEVNQLLRDAADGALSGVLGVTDLPLVSSDFIHNPLSSVLATDQTHVGEGGMVRLLAWYDNEWGFSNRMLDTATVIHASASI